MTALFSGQILSLLQQHAANPAAGWRAKDAAIYIVIALTIKGGTSKQVRATILGRHGHVGEARAY